MMVLRLVWINKCSWCHYVVLLWLCYHTASGQDLQEIFPIIEAGTDGTLNCSVSHVGETLWWFRGRDPGSRLVQIAQGRTVLKPEQYDLEVSGNDTELVLTVKNAEEDDEGIYFCQDQGTTTVQFNLTVEIPPIVHLENMENEIINDTIDVIFKKETPVQCVATGSKPAVSLSWEVNDQEETGASPTDYHLVDGRKIASELLYIPNLEDKTLACVTGGQLVVPSVRVEIEVNVMYEPICNLLVTNEITNEFRLFCSCDANPSPSNYSIYVNGTLHSSKRETFISSHQAATAYCSAYNIIGKDTTDEQELTPFQVPQPNSHVALIVCVCVAVSAVVVIVVFIFYWWKRRSVVKMDQERNIALVEHARTSRIATQLPLPPEESSPLTEKDLSDPTNTEKISTDEWKRLHGDGDGENV